MSDWIAHIEASFQNAVHGRSKLTPEILNMDGLSGTYTRHFYNNLCSLPGAKYLEVGTWKGSTACSAMCGNPVECTCIDSWFQGGTLKQEFLENLAKYKGNNEPTIHDSDSWSEELFQKLAGKTFNIYLYDGDHTETAHYNALAKYIDFMADTFIYIVDDWNASPQWVGVKNGTYRAIADLGLRVLYSREEGAQDANNPHGWWNGIGVFVLEKRKEL